MIDIGQTEHNYEIKGVLGIKIFNGYIIRQEKTVHMFVSKFENIQQELNELAPFIRVVVRDVNKDKDITNYFTIGYCEPSAKIVIVK
jgi:hypothetical protein